MYTVRTARCASRPLRDAVPAWRGWRPDGTAGPEVPATAVIVAVDQLRLEPQGRPCPGPARIARACEQAGLGRRRPARGRSPPSALRHIAALAGPVVEIHPHPV